MYSRLGDDIAWSWRPVDQPTDVDESLVAALRRHVPVGSRVLEIGVGAGYALSRLASQSDSKCFGIDMLGSAVTASRETARRAGTSLGLVLGSGFGLPFADGTFDVVLSTGVIEHFAVAQSRQMLHEHARVCRSGGRVLVSTPNRLDWLHSLVRAWQGREYPYYPERSYTPWALARELRSAGLIPLAWDGFGLFWSLREHKATYLFGALLHKLGLMSRMVGIRNRRLCVILGNMVLVAAIKPYANVHASAAGSLVEKRGRRG